MTSSLSADLTDLITSISSPEVPGSPTLMSQLTCMVTSGVDPGSSNRRNPFDLIATGLTLPTNTADNPNTDHGSKNVTIPRNPYDLIATMPTLPTNTADVFNHFQVELISTINIDICGKNAGHDT
jgi:hypothetical protein